MSRRTRISVYSARISVRYWDHYSFQSSVSSHLVLWVHVLRCIPVSQLSLNCSADIPVVVGFGVNVPVGCSIHQ